MNPLVSLSGIFADACNNKPQFLGLDPWYRFLTVQSTPGGNGCEIQNFVLLGSHSTLLLVLLAVVDDLLRLVGLFSVIYVVYAGVKYIMSTGSPDETGKALGAIRNAISGLVIAAITVPLVEYLGSRFHDSGAGKSSRLPGLDVSSLPNVQDIATGNIVSNLLSVTFAIVGALALLFIVIGGYNYVLSNGEGPKVAKAKQTIIYALVGLAVAIVAQSIISFITHRL